MIVASVLLSSALTGPTTTSPLGSRKDPTESAAVSMTGGVPLTAGSTAFYATVLAGPKADFSPTFRSVSTASSGETFDYVSLNRLVSSFQSIAAANVDAPLESLAVDVWFAANGLIPSTSSTVNARVADFAASLSDFVDGLISNISVLGNAANDAAEELAGVMTSALTDTYLINTDDINLSDYGHPDYESSYAWLEPAAIGFGVSSQGAVIFDSAQWQATYESDPNLAAVSFNVLATAVLAASQTYSPKSAATAATT